MKDNNNIVVVGKVESIAESHVSTNAAGKKRQFFRMIVGTPRKSETLDHLPFIVSDKLLVGLDLKEGDAVRVEGQIRSRDYEADGKNKVDIYAHAVDIDKIEEGYAPENKVFIEGYICKKSDVRQGTSGRIIADCIIVCNRRKYFEQKGKVDYVPCVSWGTTAKMLGRLSLGTKVQIEGRFQSREFTPFKKSLNFEKRVAYEVSVIDMDVVSEGNANNDPPEAA